MAAKKVTNVEEPVKEVIKETIPTTKIAKVNAENGLNLRAGKSLEADIITILSDEEEVNVEGKTIGGWTKVSTKNGDTGYVVSEYLVF